jgi:hypothetical protein
LLQRAVLRSLLHQGKILVRLKKLNRPVLVCFIVVVYDVLLSPNCGVSTRREEKSGATFTVVTFSEHEECRVCLEPGLKRRCCGHYYCDDCYYSVDKCRSCQTKVGVRGIGYSNRAEWVAVLLGWMSSFLFVLVMCAFAATLGASESLTPQGISDYSCDGFFRKCSVSVCVDLKEDVANGTSSLPPIHTWQPCELSSTVKMISYGCIFDTTLFKVCAVLFTL